MGGAEMKPQVCPWQSWKGPPSRQGVELGGLFEVPGGGEEEWGGPIL